MDIGTRWRDGTHFLKTSKSCAAEGANLWQTASARRKLRELVAVPLGKGGEPLPDRRNFEFRRSGRGMRPSVASSKKRSIPAGEKMRSTLVGSVPGLEGWWTAPRGTTTNEPAGAVILRAPIVLQRNSALAPCAVETPNLYY